MKINSKSVSIWTLPIILSSLFELFFANFRWYNVQNFIENCVFVISIWILLSLITLSKMRAVFSKILFLIFVLFLTLETSFFYLFNTFFSASSIFIFLETNSAEVKEFLNSYVTIHLIIFLLVQHIFIGVYLFNPFKQPISLKFNLKPGYKIVLLLILISLLKISGFTIASFPIHLLKGSIGYYYEVQKFKDSRLDQEIGHLKHVKFEGGEEPHTFVLIIGESTARKQMSLYGLERNTTPLLFKRKDDLLIYQDVISSHSHTIPSLQDALIYEDHETKLETSIIQLMNQAGFKTFWLSNQRPIGIYETLLTKLSKASSFYKYTNTTRWGSVTPYDEVLLPLFNKAIEDPHPKKFIVINFLATHGNYALRYPKRFDHFKTEPETKFPSEESFEIINHYHNSIRYVDFLIDDIIKQVESTNRKSYVLYFSDHGEEVFYEKNFKGHNESDIPTESMYEIPFILWTSPQYNLDFNPQLNQNKPYILSDFIHSLSHISKINFTGLNLKKSIFFKDYQPSKRIIGKGLDFDLYFKE